MGIFSYNKARLQQKYSTNPENFAYGQEKVWEELSPTEKASSLFQKYSAGAKEMAVGMGKAALETSAAIADVVTRIPGPLQGIKTNADVAGSMIYGKGSVTERYQQGIEESQAGKTYYEKVTGKDLTNPDGSINWEEGKRFIGRAAEAPTYIYSGVKTGAQLIGKGLLNRILTRTVTSLPEAGINTALQAGEEGTTENLGKNFLMNALLMSGVSNIVGEIKLPKEVLKETTGKIEKEIGTLSPEQKVDVEDALKQGVKSDEIVTNLKKVVNNEVTPDEVAEVINKQVQSKDVKVYNSGEKDTGFSTPDKEFSSQFKDKGTVKEKIIKSGDYLDTRIPEQRQQLEGILGKDTVDKMVSRTDNGLPNHFEKGEQDALINASKEAGYKGIVLSETDKTTKFNGRDVVTYADNFKSQPPKEGVTKTPGVAKAAHDINVSLAKKGLDALPEEDLSKYTPTTKEKVGEKIASVMDDWENAKKIALTNEDLPEGIPATAFFESVVAKAEKEGDIQLMRELASSPMASKSSEAGQQLGATGWFKENQSVVSKIKEVSEARVTAAEKRLKSGSVAKTQAKAHAQYKEIRNKIIKTKQTWNDFIEEIKCK